MDREIKFRAYVKEHWIGRNHGDDMIYDFQDTIYWEFHDEVAIMQFTGLQDKNGKDIYEGDILKAHFDTTTPIMKVEYINGSFRATGKREFKRFPDDSEYSKDLLTKEFTKDCEVIGNIHENHDLL